VPLGEDIPLKQGRQKDVPL